MEVFSVLATMNLVDMMSSPLNKINKTIGTSKEQLKSMDTQINSVLTNAMFPLAIAAGAVVTALGSCVGSAVEFESAMADVAKVVNFTSQTELKGMESAILDMSTKIPMAADGIAAIIASAGQSGVAKENLTEFAEQAAKMGVAFDLTGDQAGKMMADWRAGMGLSLRQTYDLADAVNHLSNNMNATAPALGEVLQRAGALGMVAGGLETEVAALGAAFLSAGASPEIAATALKKFTMTLTKSTAMTEKQVQAFKSLGFDAVELAKRMQGDAKGAITDVLTALSKFPEYTHGAMLTEMFGEESIGAISPLLKNMDTLANAFELVSDKTKYAGSMQAEFEVRSKTVANAIQLLQNKLKKLSIIIGNYLLPAVSAIISLFSGITGAITKIIDNPLGQIFIETAGAISLAALALSGYLLAVKYGGFVLGFFTEGLAAVKVAFLGLSLPVQGLIILISALYLAYKANLGGIADSVSAFYTKAELVFKGVTALLKNFKKGSAVITGDLVKQIKAAGLQEVVFTLFKLFRRLHAFVTGFFDGISRVFLVFREVFGVVFTIISYPIKKLIELLGFLGIKIDDTENLLETGIAQSIGVLVGGLAGFIGVIGTIIKLKKAWLFISKPLLALLKVMIIPIKKLGTALKTAMFFMKTGAIKAWTGACSLAHKMSLLWSAAVRGLGTALKATMLFMKAGAIKAWTGACSLAYKMSLLWSAAVRGLGTALKATMLFMKAGVLKAYALACGLAAKAVNLLTLGVRGLGIAFKFLAANPIILIITAIIAVIGVLIYYFDDIVAWLKKVGTYFAEIFSAAWGHVSNFLTNLLNYWKSLGLLLIAPFRFWFGTIKTIVTGIWDFIVNIFSGKSLFESGAALINTFKEGILSAWQGLKDSFTDVLASLREMLPFSDAKKGPLSTLTLSGNRLISTIGEGVSQAAPAFLKNINGVFSQINPSIDTANLNVPNMSKQLDMAFTPYLNSPVSPVEQEKITAGKSSKENNNGTSYTITIQNITLPNVQKGEDFINQLQNELLAYGA